jgi:opacity protein-like surface antigen
MSFTKKSAPFVALTVVLLFTPARAQAQERLRVSFAPAVATVSGDAELALGGTVGYRFSEHFWFDGEITWIDAAAGGFRDHVAHFDRDQLDSFGLKDLMTRGHRFGSGRFAGYFPNLPDLPAAGRASIDGQTTIGTLGVRYELPVQTERFRPYLSGGLGLNYTSQDFRVDGLPSYSGFDDSVSHTGYAFTGGAGASIRIFDGLWGDVDARYVRLSRDRDIMRLGGGVSVRF